MISTQPDLFATADELCPITGMTRDELAALPDAPAEAPPAPVRPAPPVSAGTRLVAGAGGRDFRYVGVVRITGGGRGTGPIIAECGHEHTNRDWSTGAAGGSAKDCARQIIAGAERPETADYTAKRIRTAPMGLRPGAGFQHPAGTMEAAREIAEANAESYLAAVALVREHLHPTPEAPVTEPTTAAAAAGVITVDTDTDGEMCDQCQEDATHRVLVDGFPLYRVCAGHVARVKGYAREAIAARATAAPVTEPTTAAIAPAAELTPAPAAAADEPDTTCPVCGCETYEDDLFPIGDSDPMCYECRREHE